MIAVEIIIGILVDMSILLYFRLKVTGHHSTICIDIYTDVHIIGDSTRKRLLLLLLLLLVLILVLFSATSFTELLLLALSPVIVSIIVVSFIIFIFRILLELLVILLRLTSFPVSILVVRTSRLLVAALLAINRYKFLRLVTQLRVLFDKSMVDFVTKVV